MKEDTSCSSFIPHPSSLIPSSEDAAVSLTTPWTELNTALKDLRVLWQQTRAEWNDPVSQEFEERYWDQLENQVVAALRAMDRLAPILAKAQRDCS